MDRICCHEETCSFSKLLTYVLSRTISLVYNRYHSWNFTWIFFVFTAKPPCTYTPHFTKSSRKLRDYEREIRWIRQQLQVFGVQHQIVVISHLVIAQKSYLSLLLSYPSFHFYLIFLKSNFELCYGLNLTGEFILPKFATITKGLLFKVRLLSDLDPLIDFLDLLMIVDCSICVGCSMRVACWVDLLRHMAVEIIKSFYYFLIYLW